jgi:uncharacterized membrane protein
MRLSFVAVAATVLFSSLWIGCGDEDEESLGDCPTNSSAAEAAGQDIVVAQCVYCHSSDSVGATRQGAPEDLNYDKLDIVRTEAAEMYEEAKSGAMPPTGTKITGTDLENMRVWLACGAKDTNAP